MTRATYSSRRISPWAMLCMGVMLIGIMPASANGQPLIDFELELTQLDLSLDGVTPLPLASDPTNALGDSIEGYGFVNSAFSLSLSSQRAVNPGQASLGSARAAPLAAVPSGTGVVIPSSLDGEPFEVNSFFDVYVDLTITDDDNRPGRDFAGQPNGASIVLQDVATRIRSNHEATFDANAPNFGLFPPPEDGLWAGFFNVEIPLGGDINGNGEDDKMKFVLGLLSAQDDNRSFITLPDGTVVNQFESEGFLQGAVVDESTDPPFLIGLRPDGSIPSNLTGPTIATSRLLNDVSPIPVPAAFWLFGTALVGFVAIGRRRKLG